MENQGQQNLTQGQAVNVLIQAARIAQSKGAFTLEDAELVSKAIRVFVPEGTNTEQDPAINNENTAEEPQAEMVEESN